MPADKDYYQILQVHPTAEPEIIQAAYKRLCLKYHPDTNKSPDATRRMQDINEAYAVLSDPQKRAEYDRRTRHPPLKTTAERQTDERQQRLATMYEQGMQLFAQNRWADAIAVFDRLVALDPAYRDARAKRQAAQRALEEQRRAARLAQLYREAMEDYRAERWQTAIPKFKEILRLDPGDRNIPHLLQEAEKQNRLAKLYTEALNFLQQENWREAVVRFENILSQSPHYRDVAERLRHAQHQQWMADLTDQAIDYIEQKRYAEAEKTWAQLRQMRHTDVSPSGPASPGTSRSSTRPAWQTVAGIVLALLAIALLVIVPSLRPTPVRVPRQPPTPTQAPRRTATVVATPTSAQPPTARLAVSPARPISSPTVMMATPIIPMPRQPPTSAYMQTPPGYRGGGSPTTAAQATPTSLSAAPPRSIVTATLALSTSMPATVTSRVANKDNMVMVYVPAGEFLMGSAASDPMAQNDEKPQRAVYLDAFWIDRTEVTNAQYKKCVSAGACKASSYANDPRFNGDNQPIVGVDWSDAQAYCRWAGRQLPTEAQWEKAARGVDGRVYPWGNQTATCEYAVMNDGGGSGCGKGEAAWPVSSKPKNVSPYRALDMAGNVWEWVADWYLDKYYTNSPSRNPQGPSSGQRRAVRGGGWHGSATSVRGASRSADNPDLSSTGVGFRCLVGMPSE